MFNIGIWEFLIILTIIIILIKPEDLPIFIRKLGKLYAQIQNYIKLINKKSNTFKNELENMLELKDNPTKTQPNNQKKDNQQKTD